MAAKIGLGFQLSASAAGMASGINAGVNELQKLGNQAKRTASDVRVLKTLELSKAFLSAVTTAAQTFQRFTSGAAQAVDETAKLARSLGLSYAELNELQIAADLAGVSSERLAGAFTRAAVTISQAQAGSSTATKALDTLGLSVQSLAGLSTSEQFAKIAESIAAIENPTARAAAAVGIFGRSGAELLPLFDGIGDQIRKAAEFAERFNLNLTNEQAKNVENVNDAFKLVSETVKSLSARVVAELSPVLVKASEQFAEFIAQLDVQQIASYAERALDNVRAALSLLASVAEPLARNLLPSIGAALAFINREAIRQALLGLGRVLSSAAVAAYGLATGANVAAGAMLRLRAGISAVVSSTGVGILIAVLGYAATAALEWGFAGESAAQRIQKETEEARQSQQQFSADLQKSIAKLNELGEAAEKAFTVPKRVTQEDIVQDLLKRAEQQFKAFATEVGNVAAIPSDIAAAFEAARAAAQLTSDGIYTQSVGLRLVEGASRKVIDRVEQATAARKKEADAIAETAKAAEDARKRVAELVAASVPRDVTLSQQASSDLIAIEQERLRLAEEIEQAQVRAVFSSRSASAAAFEQVTALEQQLALLDQADAQARQADRDRRLQVAGLSADIFELPEDQLGRQFATIGEIFANGLISELERARAVDALGLREAREILRDLSGRAAVNTRALQVDDIRSSAGASSFLALATGRQDPEAQARREQIAKLEQIRQAIERAGLSTVELIG